MIEQFDVVDTNDQVTGQLTTKLVAHQDATLHRLVAVYVFDADGNLIVQDHKASGLLDHSVGGHVSAGETYDQAARREAAEELGLGTEALELVLSSLHSNEYFDPAVQTGRQQHFFSVYECHLAPDWQFAETEEVAQIFRWPLETVVAKMVARPGRFTPGMINTMAEYLAVKQLPYKYDLAQLRNNWGKTR